MLREGLDPIPDPPVKPLKEEDLVPNHLLGHLSGVPALDLVLDQDLLPTQGADLDHPLIVGPPPRMKLIYLFGKDTLLNFLSIKEIF